MASKNPDIDEVQKTMTNLSLGPSSETDDYYPSKKGTKVGFARLEKGLLLFIYVYETTKNILAVETALWNHRVCVNVIKTGACSKPVDECRCEHQSDFRQADLCHFWYLNDRCNYGDKCKNSHRLENVRQYHRYLRTETDADVFKLVRFVRNFAGHYIDSVIRDQDRLYRDIVVLMIHLVHALSPKHNQSIEHLELFLDKTTINQLISSDDILRKLDQPLDIPAVFFDIRCDYTTPWYPADGSKQLVDFRLLSTKLISLFNTTFVSYYNGRLKSRGAKAPWP